LAAVSRAFCFPPFSEGTVGPGTLPLKPPCVQRTLLCFFAPVSIQRVAEKGQRVFFPPSPRKRATVAAELFSPLACFSPPPSKNIEGFFFFPQAGILGTPRFIFFPPPV